MAHGFVNSVGNLQAANQALRAIGAFLSDQLTRCNLEASPEHAAEDFSACQPAIWNPCLNVIKTLLLASLLRAR
jgi:hypothetical protein